MVFATRHTTWSGNTPTVCCNTFSVLDWFRFRGTFGAIVNKRSDTMNVNEIIKALKMALVYDAFVMNAKATNLDNMKMLVAVATGKAPTMGDLLELVKEI